MKYSFPYYSGDFEALTSDDHWKKDEILAAKIKKFLSVSCVHVRQLCLYWCKLTKSLLTILLKCYANALNG